MLRAMLLRMKQGAYNVLNRHLSGESINFRQVIAIIIPLLVDQVFIVMLTLLNTAMISSSGKTSVAAVSMVDSLNVIIYNIFIALATGGTVVVAQYKGAENTEGVSKATANTLISTGLISLLIGLLTAAFHAPLLSLLFGKAEQAVISKARLYLICSALSYPLTGITDAITGALRGTGNTKASLWLSLLKNGSYVFFNLIFLTFFKMGILGLVISLIISRLLGALFSLVYIFKVDRSIELCARDLLYINFAMLRTVLLYGIPFAAEQIFFNGGKLLTQTFIVALGTNALAINAICNSLSPLTQIGALACSLAIVTVVGQCIGRKNFIDAKKFIHSFIVMGSLSSLVITLSLLPLLSWLISLFSPSAGIISEIKTILYISWAATPFLYSTSFVTPAALRAAGDARFTLLSSLLSMWLLRVVLGYILGVVVGFGIVGVWVAMVVEWGVRSLIFQLRIHGSKWLSFN